MRELINLVEKSINDRRTNKTVWAILYTPKKVILGKRAPSTNNPNQWNFFGGHVDQGESNIEALIRELKEETGYDGSSLSFKEITTIGNSTYYSARINDASSLQTTKEISNIKGFSITDLPDNLHSKTENFFSNLDYILN
jgi:8-oxo-dGTP pyrophosphatase MutT (NUDIX family)